MRRYKVEGSSIYNLFYKIEYIDKLSVESLKILLEAQMIADTDGNDQQLIDIYEKYIATLIQETMMNHTKITESKDSYNPNDTVSSLLNISNLLIELRKWLDKRSDYLWNKIKGSPTNLQNLPKKLDRTDTKLMSYITSWALREERKRNCCSRQTNFERWFAFPSRSGCLVPSHASSSC